MKGNPWLGHPYNPKNNVNGFDGDKDGDALVDLHSPEVRGRDATYVKKVIDMVNDLDNVLYEVANEGGNKDWNWFIVNLIHEYEKTRPNQHPVGLTAHGDESNDSMLASPADWFSPGANQWPDLKTDPRAVDGKKVSILDTDHIWGEGGDYRWVWKSFLRGYNPIYMDRIAVLTGDSRGDIPGAEDVRKAIGHTRAYARRVNLTAMVPRNDLASTEYCLANPGIEYLIYLPDGGKVTVDLSVVEGSFAVEWFNPRMGTVTKSGTIAAESSKLLFQVPFEGDAALYLKAADAPIKTGRGR